MNNDEPAKDLAEPVGPTPTGIATQRDELRRQIMSHGVAKNEREWWACREIERLRGLIADERMACAKIADECAFTDDPDVNEVATSIADAIRARPIVTY